MRMPEDAVSMGVFAWRRIAACPVLTIVRGATAVTASKSRHVYLRRKVVEGGLPPTGHTAYRRRR